MRLASRFRFLALVAGLTGLAACTDAPERSITAPTDAARRTVVPSAPMGSYHFQAPALRPWDTDTNALRGELQAAQGRVYVTIKRPASPHALQNGGWRGALGSGDFDRGLASVVASGATVLRQWPGMGQALVQISADSATALLRNPAIDFMDADRPLPASAPTPGTSTTARAPLSAALTRSPWTLGPSTHPLLTYLYGDAELDKNAAMSQIQAPEAWSTSNGAGVRVMFVVSDGIQTTHPDLPPIPVGNCGGQAYSCTAVDSESYGAYDVLGPWMELRNSSAAVGSAPGLDANNIFIWRIVPRDSSNWTVNSFSDAVDNAAALGVKVMAVSGIWWSTENATLNSDVGYAWDHDILMIAGAQEGPSIVRHPAGLSQVVGVSGVTSDDAFASATNPLVGSYCASWPSGYGTTKVQIAAPYKGWVPGPSGSMNGSSCFYSFLPVGYVAGVASLIRAHWPTWTVGQARDQLLSTARPAGDAQYYGYGIVNAKNAMIVPLTVSITGASTIKTAGTYSWSASASGGTGPYTYTWERSDDGGSTYYAVSTASSVSAYVDNSQPTIDWRVTAQSGTQGGVGRKHVSIVIP